MMATEPVYRCILHDPPWVRRRDHRGRFERGPFGSAYRFLETKPSPYFAEGNLAYEMAHPGQTSHKPYLEFCPDCLQRMGIKLPMVVG